VAFFMVMICSFATASEKLSVSLEKAIEHALEYNKNMLNAGLAVDEANLKIRETLASGLPQIDAKVDYNNFMGSSASLGGMTFNFNPTSNLVVSVGQLIFSGSYIVGVQSSKLFRSITETGMQKTALEIKAQVTSAYYLALVAQRSGEIIDQNLDNLREVYKQSRAMADFGIIESIDADQLSVQLVMIENASRASARQLELSYNLLRLQMGVSAETELELVNSLDEVLAMANVEGTVVTPFAIEDNLDFQLMQVQEQLSRKQVSLERVSFLPTITGFYSYTEKLMKPEVDFSPKNVVGLNMAIPVFSSGMRRARVSQARVRLETTRNNRDLLSEQLLIQEKQLRYNLKTAMEQHESQKSNVEVAQRVYQNYALKFQQGMASGLDLTTAHNNYLQAENQYISGLMSLLEAQLALQKLMSR
jgi:outer membrane protein